jgi:hypothetical protein
LSIFFTFATPAETAASALRSSAPAAETFFFFLFFFFFFYFCFFTASGAGDSVPDGDGAAGDAVSAADCSEGTAGVSAVSLSTAVLLSSTEEGEAGALSLITSLYFAP